jgi:HSP20 family protein
MIQRWDPFNELRQRQHNMARMRRRAANNFSGSPENWGFQAWAVPLDVISNGEDTVVRASMPGVSPEDIQVSIEDNVLTIKGHSAEERQEGDGATFLMRERRSGSFHRALRLPDSVDPDKVEPRYEHGVLTITVPKAEAKRARQLPVQVGGAPATEAS